MNAWAYLDCVNVVVWNAFIQLYMHPTQSFTCIPLRAVFISLYFMHVCMHVCTGMEFKSGPECDAYDYQFVKWLAKEKVCVWNTYVFVALTCMYVERKVGRCVQGRQIQLFYRLQTTFCNSVATCLLPLLTCLCTSSSPLRPHIVSLTLTPHPTALQHSGSSPHSS